MDGIDTIKSYLGMLDSALGEVMPEIKALSNTPLEEKLQTMNDPLDRAEYLNAVSYTLTSLIFAYYKSKGIDTASNPIMEELERVKQHVATVKECREIQQQKLAKKDKDIEVVKSTIQKAAYEPAISKANFKGRHKRFSDETAENVTKKLRH